MVILNTRNVKIERKCLQGSDCKSGMLMDVTSSYSTEAIGELHVRWALSFMHNNSISAR